MKDKTKQTPLADLKKSALEHYEKAASAVEAYQEVLQVLQRVES